MRRAVEALEAKKPVDSAPTFAALTRELQKVTVLTVNMTRSPAMRLPRTWHPMIQTRNMSRHPTCSRERWSWMIEQRDTVARAFELARGGTCASPDDIRRALTRGGFECVAAHLSGPTMKRQLVALFSARKLATS